MSESKDKKSRAPVKKQTQDSYDRRLNYLNNGEPIDNYAFLHDVNVVMEKIQKFKPGTQRNYMIAIVSALKNVPVMSSVLKTYTDLMDKFNSELKVNNTKSETQKENWITQGEVEQVYNKILDDNIDHLCMKRKNITEPFWSSITDLIVLSLFILQAPRRILDYRQMYITKGNPKELDATKNYYVVSTHTFIFNNYKTAGIYKTQTQMACPKLQNILDCYIKIHPIKLTASNEIPMLCNFRGEPYTVSCDITRILNRIFKRECGKRVSINLLRNIYLTDKFGSKISELKDTASLMGTSSNTIENTYVKVD